MKRSIVCLAVTLLSLNAFALTKKSIYGKDALEIVEAISKLNVKAIPRGNSDSGYVQIKLYKFLDMECETALSNYGGHGSKLVSGCHFDKVASKAKLNEIRSILKTIGLSPSNEIFKP